MTEHTPTPPTDREPAEVPDADQLIAAERAAVELLAAELGAEPFEDPP